VRIDGVPAIELLAAMSAVATSAGSACHAGLNKPSPVLVALGLSTSSALSAIRLSLGRWSTEDEIDKAVDHVVTAVRTLAHSPVNARP
jgi:cysteine desulfurase